VVENSRAGTALGRSGTRNGPGTRRSSSALRIEAAGGANRPASHIAAGHTATTVSCRPRDREHVADVLERRDGRQSRHDAIIHEAAASVSIIAASYP